MGTSDQIIALAGDIGGTKTNLGLFVAGEDRPEMLVMESYLSNSAAGLSELISRFLEAHPRSLSSACFGIAGPVIDGVCKATNLPWETSETEIKSKFNWGKVRLINDLTATAQAVPLLQDYELHTLNAMRPEPGNIGVIAPGTGLGISLLVLVDGKLQPSASEGGHADFAPRNEDEVDLWRHLRNIHGHVSVERLVSGPGISAIYSWLKQRDHFNEPAWFTEKMRLNDPPAVISEAALVEKLEPCIKTLELFVSILAAVAGNLALTGMTGGGIYIGGGIVPRILPIVKKADFMKAFTDKGRFRELLSGIPVHVILNDHAALLGAAWSALEGEIMESDRESIDTYVDLTVKGSAPDLKVPPQACLVDRSLNPCSIVIFGATGDLTKRKLAPSLYNLYSSGAFPESFAIVGAARSDISREQFQQEIKQALEKMDLSRWDDFASHLHYYHVDYGSQESLQAFADSIKKLDSEHDTESNRIFYLAVPPSAYGKMAAMLGKVGLAGEDSGGNGWSRIVVEKPFGHDLESARELNRELHEYFSESQIFRIDHYLAKETVQNVSIFRFANSIFEPLWNRMYIDHVHINAVESLGVEKRAASYEEAGVIRDMFQNHMMQLLAVTAMEPPALFKAEQVRDEQVKVFHALRPVSKGDPFRNLVLGQYGPGTVDGKPVQGYRDEPGIDANSLTPTFGMMTVFVDNWRWQDVPFHITSGKRLAKKVTEIAISFKKVPHLLFQNVLGDAISPNLLTMQIHPEEKINLTFETKNPGAKVCLRPVTMDFNYNQNYEGPILDAYEKALIDCIQGDHMLFWREDAVELCWAFIDPILEDFETRGNRKELLLTYAAGTWGPDVNAGRK